MTSIAREHNVSVNTVQRVLASCSHRFIDGYDYLPEHLAFDELEQAIRKYIDYYDTERTEDRLRGLTPIEYRNKSLVA